MISSNLPSGDQLSSVASSHLSSNFLSGFLMLTIFQKSRFLIFAIFTLSVSWQ